MKLALGGGNWVILLLLLASIGSVAVMFERWRVFRANRSRGDELAPLLAGRLSAGDTASALEVARGFNCLEGRVAAAGLEAFAMGREAVADILASALIRERNLLERRLIVLGTLGNNAPFVGLFGTVLGIIKAFNDLAITGSAGVSVVMAGISSALVATAFGILVAIPAVIANNYFRSRLEEIESDSERINLLLLAHLSSQKPGTGRK
jgi:biopolymer transport protein ExbB